MRIDIVRYFYFSDNEVFYHLAQLPCQILSKRGSKHRSIHKLKRVLHDGFTAGNDDDGESRTQELQCNRRFIAMLAPHLIVQNDRVYIVEIAKKFKGLNRGADGDYVICERA